jgi:SsrA-binding protein
LSPQPIINKGNTAWRNKFLRILGEAINAHIGEYEHGNIFNHEPLRTRKLLVHKNELDKVMGKTQQKGLTLIPTWRSFKHGRVKVEMALAKGKQTWDKRETERRCTADKEAREAIARSRRA